MNFCPPDCSVSSTKIPPVVTYYYTPDLTRQSLVAVDWSSGWWINQESSSRTIKNLDGSNEHPGVSKKQPPQCEAKVDSNVCFPLVYSESCVGMSRLHLHQPIPYGLHLFSRFLLKTLQKYAVKLFQIIFKVDKIINTYISLIINAAENYNATLAQHIGLDDQFMEYLQYLYRHEQVEFRESNFDLKHQLTNRFRQRLQF